MANGKILKGFRRVKSVGIENGGNNQSEPIGSVDASTDDISDTGSDTGAPDASAASDTAVDPRSLDGSSSSESGEPRKRRGRKPGSKNGVRKETPQDLTALLYSLHLMGAGLCNAPEFMLAQDEAERLAVCIARVNELYDGIVIDPKTMALIQLTLTASSIYGPRIMLVLSREKTTSKRNVVTMAEFNTVASVPEGVN